MKTLPTPYDFQFTQLMLDYLGVDLIDLSIAANGELTDQDAQYRFKRAGLNTFDIYKNKEGFYSMRDSVVLRTYYPTPEELALDLFLPDHLEEIASKINSQLNQSLDYF